MKPGNLISPTLSVTKVYIGEDALLQDAHHQGMDYIMLKALEADLQGKLVYPATLNDLALWTSVSPWSKVSIAERKTIYFQ